jgi:hypothetical protein
VLNTTAPRSFTKRRSASPHQLVDGVPSPDFGDTRRRARPCRAFILETSSKNTSLLERKLRRFCLLILRVQVPKITESHNKVDLTDKVRHTHRLCVT